MLSEDEMHAGEPFCVQNLFLSQSINNFLALGFNNDQGFNREEKKT